MIGGNIACVSLSDLLSYNNVTTYGGGGDCGAAPLVAVIERRSDDARAHDQKRF